MVAHRAAAVLSMAANLCQSRPVWNIAESPTPFTHASRETAATARASARLRRGLSLPETVRRIAGPSQSRAVSGGGLINAVAWRIPPLEWSFRLPSTPSRAGDDFDLCFQDCTVRCMSRAGSRMPKDTSGGRIRGVPTPYPEDV
jgi:hypothetical protein